MILTNDFFFYFQNFDTIQVNCHRIIFNDTNFFFQVQNEGNMVPICTMERKSVQWYVDLYNYFVLNDYKFDSVYSKCFKKIMPNSLPDKSYFETVVLNTSLTMEKTRRTTIKKQPVMFITFFESPSQVTGVVALLGCDKSFLYQGEIILTKNQDADIFNKEAKTLLLAYHTTLCEQYNLNIEFVVLDRVDFLDLENTGLPFEVIPCSNLVNNSLLVVPINWTDCVNMEHQNLEQKKINQIHDLIQEFHKDESKTIGQILQFYVEKIFALINDLTLANASIFTKIIKTHICTGPFIMAAFLDPQIFEKIFENQLYGINLKLILFHYIAKNQTKHEFLRTDYTQYKNRGEFFAELEYSEVEKKIFWELIAQERKYDQFVEWVKTLIDLPAYVPNVGDEWFAKFQNLQNDAKHLELRKLLRMNEL